MEKAQKSTKVLQIIMAVIFVLAIGLGIISFLDSSSGSSSRGASSSQSMF